MTTINLDYQPDAAYYGDCEEIIQAWKEQGVQGIIDLIYLDPPFNSNRNYGHPTAKAKKSETGSMDAFSDMWTYDDQAIQRVQNICNSYHPARELIKALKPYLHKHDSGMLAYLSYMADRLRLFHGLLKETGSIYLHCDPFANYYLRLLMDAIFGAKNFRNEIIWNYQGFAKGFKSNNKYCLPKNHDSILFYAKSKEHKIITKPSVVVDLENEPGYTKDEHGWFSTRPFNNNEDLGKLPEHCVYRTRSGKTRIKRYVSNPYTKTLGNVWTDILDMTYHKGESEGYPTQKPLKLLDRIIQASTNEGDLVLDPFAGCGTTMHSAVKNKRRFIGIDVSVHTIHEVCRKRLKEKCGGLDVPIFGIPVDFAGAKLLAKQEFLLFG